MPLVPTLNQLDNYFLDDPHFCELYPLPIQQFDNKHWSPLLVVNQAVNFLANKPDAKILDIGSGSGKFCLAGAYYKPSAFFYGVEQRRYLVDTAYKVKDVLGLQNVHFMHYNFTQLSLKQYDHFYFYNSFFENLVGTDKIDNNIAYSTELYNYYSQYLYKQLEDMPVDTRVVTYCSWDDEIPSDYKLIETHLDNLLKFWKKM
jgi:SAM-dependent methyltransferase